MLLTNLLAMKRFLLLWNFLLVVCCAKSQILEPEYIGQAYALMQSGERVALSLESGYVSANSNTTTHAAFSRHNIGLLFSPLLFGSGYSVSQSYGKTVEYLNVEGLNSLAFLRVKEPFSVVLRLESNDYLPETQIKVVRFVQDEGKRRAHAGSNIPFHAEKVGNSSYQIILDAPLYGEYGVVYRNDMNAVLTFSLGYSDDDVREYVKPFLESGSVKMVRYYAVNYFDIFDLDKGEYVENDDFAEKYGTSFLNRVVEEYNRQIKVIAKANKALAKAQRKAKRALKKAKK